jgi:hypothetical protein
MAPRKSSRHMQDHRWQPSTHISWLHRTTVGAWFNQVLGTQILSCCNGPEMNCSNSPDPIIVPVTLPMNLPLHDDNPTHPRVLHPAASPFHTGDLLAVITFITFIHPDPSSRPSALNGNVSTDLLELVEGPAGLKTLSDLRPASII